MSCGDQVGLERRGRGAAGNDAGFASHALRHSAITSASLSADGRQGAAWAATWSRDMAGEKHHPSSRRSGVPIHMLGQHQRVGGGLHAGAVMADVQINQDADRAPGRSGGHRQLSRRQKSNQSPREWNAPWPIPPAPRNGSNRLRDRPSANHCSRRAMTAASPGLATVKPIAP